MALIGFRQKKNYNVFLFLLISVNCLAQPAPESSSEFAGFIEADFPFITSTLNAGTLGPMYPERNLAARCLVLQLKNDAYACFDMDLLRVAAAWTGDAISLVSMPQISYHEAGNKKNSIPEILGTAVSATGVYPGWQGPRPSFEDPRPEGPNPLEMGRGPISSSLGQWEGVYVHGENAVLRYKILGVEISEMITSLALNGETAIVRTFNIGPHTEAFSLVIGEFHKPGRVRKEEELLLIHHAENRESTAIGVTGASTGSTISFIDSKYAVLQILPNNEPASLQVITWRGGKQNFASFNEMMQLPVKTIPDVSAGGPARWGAPATTRGMLGNPQGAYAVDELTLPLPNRWRRNVRAGGIDFFSDGRAAISTYEGDVWLISGIDAQLDTITWKRFASGLCEPMSLAIVDDEIYVFGREGIVRLHDLNGDQEADFYENFTNLPVQTGESREFPLSMNPMPGGGFLISKNSALNAGPKTNPPIMNGFRAGGPHSGSIIKVSADGQSISMVASGFRGPYSAIHPEKGWITASDQQGNFVPSTPIYFVEEGDYFGVPATVHQSTIPEEKKPLTWIPHSVDRSGTEQAWLVSDGLGPLNNTLVHLSYGKAQMYRVYYDENWQGGISTIPIAFRGPLMKGKIHPVDGMFYVAGFQVWDSDAREVSALSRLRYTGGSLPMPTSFRAGKQGILLTFEQKLDVSSATQMANYNLERWNYKRTDQYGSGHFKLSEDPGQERVDIEVIMLSKDQQHVFLQVSDMQEVMQMGLSYRLKTISEDSLTHAVYFSINQLPDLNLGDLKGTYISSAEQPSIETPPGSSVQSTAERGRQIYEQTGCMACHSTDGSTEGRSGPTFQGLWGKERAFNDGSSLIANESYIKESILMPAAKTVSGKDIEMPSYLGILNDSDISSIILFIQSLE